LSEILVMGKVFIVMLCYRPIQRLSDACLCKKRKNQHVLFVTTLNTNYRDTWCKQWSTPGHLRFLPRYLLLMELQLVLLRTRPSFVDVVFRQINRSIYRNTWC